MNSIMKQLWPNVGHYTRKIIAESVEPAVKSALEGYGLSGFREPALFSLLEIFQSEFVTEGCALVTKGANEVPKEGESDQIYIPCLTSLHKLARNVNIANECLPLIPHISTEMNE